MTRDEFLNRHRHELAGIVLDAAMAHRTGAELAVFARLMMTRIDARLAAIYADVYPEPKPAPVNGTTTPARSKT